MLVAPADVDSSSHTPDEVRNFALMPLHKPALPAITVASENDPFVALNRAKIFSKNWGSNLITVGDRGHIKF